MELLLLFSIGFLLSFIGTLPPGMINLSVAQTSIYQGFKTAQAVALGAVIVEIAKTLIALKLAWLFTEDQLIIQWLAVIVFLSLSIYYGFFVPEYKEVKEKDQQKEGFFKGVFISFLNVMTYPYWIFLGAYLKDYTWFSTDWVSTLFFVLGTSIATFLMLNLYALLGQSIVKRIAHIAHTANRVLAGLFLLLGALQLIQLLL